MLKKTVMLALTLILTLSLFGCGKEVLIDPLVKIEQQCWEDWPKFQKNELSPLKDYYSNGDVIIEKGVSNKISDIRKMNENAVDDSKRNIAGAIKTDIGSVSEVFSRSFQDYALEIPGSNRELAESFYRGVIDGAVEMSRELLIYDFTPINKGYWVVRYISKPDLDVAKAREMLNNADIITQVQRDEFLKRVEGQLDQAKKKSEEIEKKLKETNNN